MDRDRLNQYKEELGWKPALPAAVVKPYVNVRLHDQVAYISGHVAVSGGTLLYKGRIGQEVGLADARKSAALAVINCLDLFDSFMGLERLDHVLKVTGYLCCTEEVTEHPAIMNAGSQILVDVFGEAGRHARAALGIHTLPHGASVEVEMVVSVKPTGLSEAGE